MSRSKKTCWAVWALAASVLLTIATACGTVQEGPAPTGVPTDPRRVAEDATSEVSTEAVQREASPTNGNPAEEPPAESVPTDLPPTEVPPPTLGAPVLVKQGLALREQGDLAGAIDAYTKAIELDPKHVQAYPQPGCDPFHAGRQRTGHGRPGSCC